MLIIVDLFYIKEKKVSVLDKLFVLGELRFGTSERLSRGVKTGVHTVFLCNFEKLGDEIYLEKCFAAAYGDTAAAFPVRLVACSLFISLLRCEFAQKCRRTPSIGIMAILAAHRAAL